MFGSRRSIVRVGEEWVGREQSSDGRVHENWALEFEALHYKGDRARAVLGGALQWGDKLEGGGGEVKR